MRSMFFLVFLVRLNMITALRNHRIILNFRWGHEIIYGILMIILGMILVVVMAVIAMPVVGMIVVTIVGMFLGFFLMFLVGLVFFVFLGRSMDGRGNKGNAREDRDQDFKMIEFHAPSFGLQ